MLTFLRRSFFLLLLAIVSGFGSALAAEIPDDAQQLIEKNEE